MTERRDLLIEIGTEELPPKSLKALSAAFTDGLATSLGDAGLEAQSVQAFATPRRLAVLAGGVPVAQPSRSLERRGPALTAAFDTSGKPTKAAEGFARSCGVAVAELERLETDKGAWLVYRAEQPGRPTPDCVPELLEQVLARLPIAKRMRWADRDTEFVRPVHWVVLLFGDQVVPATLLGQPAGRTTRGHRFHAPEPIELTAAGDYDRLLAERGKVQAGFAQRREEIRSQVAALGTSCGGRALIDEDLLDEVTALVEWPVALAGSFEDKFLEVPAEALISTMQDNQKYFPVVDDRGALLPRFITVANIDSRDPDKVREGNERVIRPRLADAAFFWRQDRSRRLESHADRLKSVVFQSRLGSLYDKSERIAQLAAWIAEAAAGDRELALRAGRLSKCDLMTEMVYEFPELQGIMGRYYAINDGEPAELAQALEEQYRPKFAGDDLPGTATGRALAIADRLDTLLGSFAIGQKPSGVKDPYGLRRAALAVLRILVEGGWDLDLVALLERGAEPLQARAPARESVEEIFDFMMERLRAYYLDLGHSPQAFEAVLARRPTRPLDFDARLRAVTAFAALPEAASLAAANKRIGNILRKADQAAAASLDTGLLREAQERELAAAIDRLEQPVHGDFEAGRYEQALNRLAGLRGPVDEFFDGVMVMAEDRRLRANRLALLERLSRLFQHVADLSLLPGA